MEISRSDSFGDRSFDECGDEEEKWDFEEEKWDFDNPVKVDDGKGESKTWNRKKSWFSFSFGKRETTDKDKDKDEDKDKDKDKDKPPQENNIQKGEESKGVSQKPTSPSNKKEYEDSPNSKAKRTNSKSFFKLSSFSGTSKHNTEDTVPRLDSLYTESTDFFVSVRGGSIGSSRSNSVSRSGFFYSNSQSQSQFNSHSHSHSLSPSPSRSKTFSQSYSQWSGAFKPSNDRTHRSIDISSCPGSPLEDDKMNSSQAEDGRHGGGAPKIIKLKSKSSYPSLKSSSSTFGHMRMVKTNVQVHVFFHYICLTENSTLVPKSTFGIIPVQGDRVLDDSEGVWSKNTIESIDQLNNINIDNGLHVKKTLYQRKGRESKVEHKMLKFVLRQQSPIMKKRSKSHEAQCYKAHHDIGFCSLDLSDAINDAEPAEGVMSSMFSLSITNLDRNSQVNGRIILSFSYTGLGVTLNRTRTGTDTKSNEVEQNNKNKYASMFSFSSQLSTNKKNVERVVKEISCDSLSQDEVMFGKSIIEEILGKRSYDQGKFLAGASYDSANSANSNGSGYSSSSSNSGSSSGSGGSSGGSGGSSGGSGGSSGSSGSSDSDSDESNLDEELADNWQTPMSMSVESYNVQDFLKMGKVGLSQSMDELGRGYEYMNFEKEKEKAKEKDVVEVRKGMIVVSMDEQKREEKEKEKELASEKASQFIPSHLASSSSSSGSGSGSAAPSSASQDSVGSFFGNVNDVAITVGGGLGSSMLNYLGFYDGSSEIDNEPVST